MDRKSFYFLIGALLCSSVTWAADLTTSVPGTACLYLTDASGVTISNEGETDISEQVQPSIVALPAGARQIQLDVSGGIDHRGVVPGCGPDPEQGSAPIAAYGEHGVNIITVPLQSLIGVFLGDSAPAPANPVTPFFVHNCHTAATARVVLDIPAGATRLALGVQDGYGWSGNTGQYNVTATFLENTAAMAKPIPALPIGALLLLPLLLAAWGGRAMRRRNS
jgi:hypothetical protein